MPPEPRRRQVGIAKHNNRLLGTVGGQPWAPGMNTPSRSYNPAVEDSPDVLEQAEPFGLKPTNFNAPKPTTSVDGRKNRERSQQKGMMDEDELGRPDAPAVTEAAGRSSRSVSRGLDDVVPAKEFSTSMLLGGLFGGQGAQQAARSATTRLANTEHSAKWVQDAEKGGIRTKKTMNTYKPASTFTQRRTRENTMSSQPQELEMKTVTKKRAPIVTNKAPVNIESGNDSESASGPRKRKEQSPPQVRGKKPQYTKAKRGSGALVTKTGVGKPVSAKSTGSGRNDLSDDEEIKALKAGLPVPTKKKFVPPPSLRGDRDSSEDSQDEDDRKTKAELAAKRKPAKKGFKNPLVTNPLPVNKELLEELGISSSGESKARVFKNPLAGYSMPERKDPSSGITVREALALARKSDDSSPDHFSDLDMDLTGYGVTKADILAQRSNSKPDPKADICKICSTSLPPHFLVPYRTANQRHILMDTWIKICEDHQALSLRTEWESRNYPTISWADLPDRCTALLPTIKRIISNDIPSDFRRTFEQQARAMNTTAVKALRSGQEFTHAGYYGPRGLNIMLHSIVKGLIDPLKAASATDPAIARTGEMAFAQDVLVPELSLRLIAKDMNVDEKKAAEILRESKDIGMKLNGEESTDDLYVGDTSGWLDVHAMQNAKGEADAMSVCSSEGSEDEGDFFAKQKAELEARESAREKAEKAEKAARMKEKVKGKMNPRRVSLTSSSSEEEKGSWEK